MSSTKFQEYLEQVQDGLGDSECVTIDKPHDDDGSTESRKGVEFFRSLPEEARGDKEFVLQVFNLFLMAFGHRVLEVCSEALRGDKEVVMAALLKDARPLAYCSDALKADKEVVVQAMSVGCVNCSRTIMQRILKQAAPALQDEKDVFMAMVNGNSNNIPRGLELVKWFESVAEKFKSDKDVVMAVVSIQGDVLQHASEALKDDKEVVMCAVDCKCSYNGGGPVLCHASEALRDDKEVVMTATLTGFSPHEPQDFEFASERLRGDKDILLQLAALKGNFSSSPHPYIAFKFATEALKKDKELVMALVKLNGDALEYASDALQNDAEVVKAAFGEEAMCLPGDRPAPGVYDALWTQENGSYGQQIVVDDSGKFEFSYDFEANQVQHQLQGEMWNSFPSPIININKYKAEYAKHPASIFKLLHISGPFVQWGEDDSNSTVKWTYRGPSIEKTSDVATVGGAGYVS